MFQHIMKFFSGETNSNVKCYNCVPDCHLLWSHLFGIATDKTPFSHWKDQFKGKVLQLMLQVVTYYSLVQPNCSAKLIIVFTSLAPIVTINILLRQILENKYCACMYLALCYFLHSVYPRQMEVVPYNHFMYSGHRLCAVTNKHFIQVGLLLLTNI